MRIQSPSDAVILSALLFPILASAAGNVDCSHIRVKNIAWDLSLLAGPKSVLSSVDQGPSWKNTTYTIDICRPLKRGKDVPKEQQCPDNTRVCGIEHIISKDEKGTDIIDRVIPIAGELSKQGGKDMNAKWERLKGSKSNEDSEKEGLILEMNGGFLQDDSKRPQKAIVEFLCDKTRVGDENLWVGEDKYDDGKEKQKREDAPAEEEDKSPSLEFVRYDTTSDKDVDVLRMKWRTKYACEDSKRELDHEREKHWGFFTWFILIAFLSTAAYLIFGSWLNYNRYGARGWDLLPHGDTIRDLPYLFKDWMRSAMNTVQGGGSRGGYAAV